MPNPYLDKSIAFLNANFQPWTFVGDEPVSVALAALLRECADNALNDQMARGLIGCQMPSLGVKIESA